jgi:hypothetical protein
MKSMKKILSAILTVALLASFFVMPVQAVSQDAQTCAAIDVLRGDGSGVTDVYLAKNTNRSQGAKILLRLMGLEVEADSYTGTATFSDASDATAYWQPMLAYLKANPTVGFQGYPDGTFAPNKIMTAQEIYKVLLVSLGYVENVDFTWGEVFTFAAGVGLTALDGVGQITNDHLATALVEAMQANKKDGQQLISFLIDEGVVDLIDAQNAGLVPTTLTIMDAFASGSKEITANLNMSVPSGTTVKLMRGSVEWPADVTWESNNKVAKFSRDYNYTPGDYTVVIGESSHPVTISVETIIGINIGADYIFPKTNQDLQVSFYNQYGEPMTIPGDTYVIVLNPSKGATLTTTNMGDTITVDASITAEVEGGDSLMITIYKDTFSQTKTIPVYEEPVIKAFYVSGLEIANAAPKIDENTSSHRLVLDATDQYGNPYVLTSTDLATFGGPVQITSSNEATVPSSSFTIDSEGKLVFNALAAGMARITFIIPTQAIVKYYEVTVTEPATLDTLIINAAGGMITSGSRYDFTSFAYDQLGASIPLLGNFDYSKFSMTSTNLLSVPMGSIQYDAVEGVLFLLPAAPGTSTVSYYYNGIYQGLIQITVYDAAEPQYIQSVDFPSNFEVGAEKDITLDNIVVRDQYSQVFDMDGSDYIIDIQPTSGTTVGLIGGTTISGSVNPTVRATSTEGTTTFTLTVEHNSTGPVAGSQFSLPITVVGTDDITSFTFDNVSLMYAGGVGATDYYKTLALSGKIGSQEVVLAGGPVPDSITLLTNSNGNFTLNTSTLELYASAAGSTTIQAWVGASPVASIVVTASAAAPEVNTMGFSPTTYTLANSVSSFDVKTILTVLDQYGINITSKPAATASASSITPSITSCERRVTSVAAVVFVPRASTIATARSSTVRSASAFSAKAVRPTVAAKSITSSYMKSTPSTYPRDTRRIFVNSIPVIGALGAKEPSS